MREEATVREEAHLPEVLEAGEEERQEGPQGKKGALMENPATWGPAERVIDEIFGKIILELAKPAEERRIGLSPARRIADALRHAGLLNGGS